MTTSRATLLSPAVAIAVAALLAGLDGTGAAASRPGSPMAAASASATGDTTTDKTIARQQATKVFKTSIGSAHVAFATAAGKAAMATDATHATNADNATNATNATHATSADSATTAATAMALGSVAYRVDTSAGAIDVPACSDNPCTLDKVGTTSAVATCPSGTVAIGGGGETYDAGVELSGSFPTRTNGSSVPNAWQVDADNFLTTQSKVDYYVICTTVKTVDDPSGI
jgi:hypothetical protein